jgi:hypothetical protein|tara:strand:- start:1360 stop:1506 length:147 start_codon:yes stop_codon:yes gene_type:complete
MSFNPDLRRIGDTSFNSGGQDMSKMTKSEKQLILEAAFSAVCDNIMAN